MNSTELPEVPRLSWNEIVKSTVLVFIFLVSFAANVCALRALYRKKSSLNKLLHHLAIADLMVAIFCDVTDAIWTSTIQWYAGDVMCRLLKFLQVFSLYLSTYVIVIIAVDRCAAVLNPLRHNKNSKLKMRLLIASVWILSAIISAPQVYIFSVQRGPFKEEYLQCVTYGSYSYKWQEEMYVVVTVLANYFIPLFIIIISYLLIVININNKSSKFTRADQVSLQSDTARTRVFKRAKIKSIRMTALIVIVFIICWTPYQVSFIVHLLLGINGGNSKYTDWIFCFGITNSMFNPLIYGPFHYKKKVKAFT